MVFVGPNGHGKTNLLESLGYLSTLSSHRVSSDAPLIRAGAERAFTGASVVNQGRELTIDVEILDGAAMKRELSTTTSSAVYTAADQTADWGAPLGPGDALDVRIFQLSALVGRGAPRIVTLSL